MSTVDNKSNRNPRAVLDERANRLDSWKEIAVYLDRQVRTAQRWEKSEGLPVHRQFHVKADTVCAFKHEIDLWLQNRCRAFQKTPRQERHSHQSVHWSSPVESIEKSTGNGCWLWLVMAADSSEFASNSTVAPMRAAANDPKGHPPNL